MAKQNLHFAITDYVTTGTLKYLLTFVKAQNFYVKSGEETTTLKNI